MKFEKKKDKIFITELPRGFDAQKIYKYLTRYIEQDYIKDFIDSSVGNDINIELVFKRGQQPNLEEVEEKMKTFSSLTPNYTLISERGVRILKKPEEIIELFAKQRLIVVKTRYELLACDLKGKIHQNNEIIKFIEEKKYIEATKQKNRKSFIEHLKKCKYTYHDYLADMPIYRMTKEEVQKRKLMIKEDKKKLTEYVKISKSPRLVKQKLIEEIHEVNHKLTEWKPPSTKKRT